MELRGTNPRGHAVPARNRVVVGIAVLGAMGLLSFVGFAVQGRSPFNVGLLIMVLIVGGATGILYALTRWTQSMPASVAFDHHGARSTGGPNPTAVPLPEIQYVALHGPDIRVQGLRGAVWLRLPPADVPAGQQAVLSWAAYFRLPVRHG